MVTRPAIYLETQVDVSISKNLRFGRRSIGVDEAAFVVETSKGDRWRLCVQALLHDVGATCIHLFESADPKFLVCYKGRCIHGAVDDMDRAFEIDVGGAILCRCDDVSGIAVVVGTNALCMFVNAELMPKYPYDGDVVGVTLNEENVAVFKVEDYAGEVFEVAFTQDRQWKRFD